MSKKYIKRLKREATKGHSKEMHLRGKLGSAEVKLRDKQKQLTAARMRLK